MGSNTSASFLSAPFLPLQLQVMQQGLRHFPAPVPQRRQLLEGHLSDEEHQEAQDHGHAEERAHDGGGGVLLGLRGDAGARGLGRLLRQQVLNVREGAVVRQRGHSQDVAQEGVEVDGAHGGLGVALAEGRPAGQEDGLHALEGVVVAVVAHCRETTRHTLGHAPSDCPQIERPAAGAAVASVGE